VATQRYAILEGTDVVNLILWDSEDEFEVLEGQVLTPAPDEVGIGWKWESDSWIQPPTPEEIIMPPVAEDPAVTSAKLEALRQLTALGITEPVARTIVGLPPA
jgi:hypothetical protein